MISRQSKNLIIILGDQLNSNISALRLCNKERDEILMMEVVEESKYVLHHKQKIVFFLAAMRNFADELLQNGYKVNYIKLENNNCESLISTLNNFLAEYYHINQQNFDKIIITHPGEYRVLNDFLTFAKEYKDSFFEIVEDDRFICSISEFRSFASDKKQLIMEFFYRYLRNKTKILMVNKSQDEYLQGDKPDQYIKKMEPIGGKYNFDKENRHFYQKTIKSKINKSLKFSTNHHIEEVKAIVNNLFKDHFGDIVNFNYATTKIEAKQALQYFLVNNIANFGEFQDVMIDDEVWLFHSKISQYLNVGLLDPLETCLEAEKLYHQNLAPLNAVEGFIRQILGWREFIRGIYWLKMPQYKESNFFNHQNKLPEFFWDSKKTKMNCLSAVINHTYQYSYSHHIQRLMITGNFALLAAIKPEEVANWYLAVYSDAIEWVELPNVLGMALFADGGIVATKPYISSGNYINKMSNFCEKCHYKISEKTGKDACPFNYLYWNFLLKNIAKLKNNPRLAIAYKNLAKFDEKQISAITNSAIDFLQNLSIKNQE